MYHELWISSWERVRDKAIFLHHTNNTLDVRRFRLWLWGVVRVAKKYVNITTAGCPWQQTTVTREVQCHVYHSYFKLRAIIYVFIYTSSKTATDGCNEFWVYSFDDTKHFILELKHLCSRDPLTKLMKVPGLYHSHCLLLKPTPPSQTAVWGVLHIVAGG